LNGEKTTVESEVLRHVEGSKEKFAVKAGFTALTEMSLIGTIQNDILHFTEFWL
jgi:hypothetical protein